MAATDRLARTWQRLSPLPGGTWLFSRVLGLMVPYTATVGAHVRELRPGYARVTLRDRRRVRNHLDCIHAVALMNLGEVTGGLAIVMGLPPGVRSILTQLRAEYFKKARGTLSAESTAAIPEGRGEIEHVVVTDIRNAAGDVVARTHATWRLGQAPAK